MGWISPLLLAQYFSFSDRVSWVVGFHCGFTQLSTNCKLCLASRFQHWLHSVIRITQGALIKYSFFLVETPVQSVWDGALASASFFVLS